MGAIEPFPKTKLIMGVLSTLPEKKEELRHILVEEFGPIDYESQEFDFTFTDYYVPEMGSGIKRFFYSFVNLVSPDQLPDIKIRTNELEERFAADGNRKINLDPGLLSLSSLILATTKNNVHRIPLQKGIYGEVTLMYVNKEYQTLPWTYSDYRTRAFHDIFKEHGFDWGGDWVRDGYQLYKDYQHFAKEIK